MFQVEANERLKSVDKSFLNSIQRIVMGEALDAITRAGQRNRDEGRIVMIQAVFERLER